MSEDDPVEIPDLPAAERIDRLVSALEPLRRVVQPQLHGIDRIPDGGALLVGNHTIYAFLDLPFLLAELWRERGIVARGLGEHAHYRIPVWRNALKAAGMVRGTRANTAELMRRGENVLVFPGGAREVNKRRGEKYQLMWKERVGFARLAAEHDYPIVPFAAVGAEEMLDIVLDDDNALYARFSGLVQRTIGWPIQPLVRGIGPTPIPRPQRLYFWFGEPVPTVDVDATDPVAVRALRDRVKAEVEAGIAFLLETRETDPDRGLARRLLRRVDGQGKPEDGE